MAQPPSVDGVRRAAPERQPDGRPAGPDARPADGSFSVPLLSRRRARGQFVQSLQHAIPATGLLTAGIDALSRGAHGSELALALVEVSTAGLLISAIARRARAGVRAADARHHDGVEWIDVWAAGVLGAEAWERWHRDGHVARPTILLAVVTLAMAVLHARIAQAGQRRRSLRVTGSGISAAGRFFRRFSAGWTELQPIAVSDRSAEMRTHGGRSFRFDFTDLENAEEVRRALAEAERRRQERGVAAAPTGGDSHGRAAAASGGRNART